MSHPVQDGARSLNANTVHYIGSDRHRNQFHAVVRDKVGKVEARYEDNTQFQEAALHE
jgi:hypothetical protein